MGESSHMSKRQKSKAIKINLNFIDYLSYIRFPGPPLVNKSYILWARVLTPKPNLFVGHSPGVGYPSSCLIPDES